MRIVFFLLAALYSIVSIAADQVSPPAPASTPASNTTPATQSIGQVIWVKGQVNAMLPQQEKRLLARKAEIYKDDTVESGKSSTAQITLMDGTLLAIAENTTIQLLKYNYDKKEPAKDSYLMNVTKGGLRTITGEIGKNNPEQTQTKTPIATLTTLGTDFLTGVKENNNTYFIVKSGKAKVNVHGKTIELTKFDKGIMVNALNNNIEILQKMPEELKNLNQTKFQNSNINNNGTTPQGNSGGFCVGK